MLGVRVLAQSEYILWVGGSLLASVAGKKNSRAARKEASTAGLTNRLEHRAPPRGGWTFADVLLPGQH